MEILVLCGIYVAELVCYQLGLRILFQVRQRTWVWMIVGILLPVGIGVLPLDSAAWKNFLTSMTVIVIIFMSIEGKIAEKGVSLVLVFLLLDCINATFIAFFDNILIGFKGNSIDNFNYLAVKCCAIIIMFLCCLIKEKMKNYNKTHINSAIYLLIGIIVCSMMFCLMLLNQATEYIHIRKYMIFCNLLNVTILFSIFFLVIFVIYIKNTHERMERLLKTEQLLKEAQVNYYNQALKKEMDTRKYRHDMGNHLIYVQDLLSRNKFDEAQQYLASILGGFKKIQNIYYVIGNEMIDTIMNYFFGMLPSSTLIDIHGKCPVDIDMEDTDICTIFSNLFQNVVEEINKSDMANARIIIKVHKGKQYVEYIIKNSLKSEIRENSNSKLPISHKYNKKNHGIGLLNVMNAVERNHGKFKWFQEDGYFCVSVILAIKNEKNF